MKYAFTLMELLVVIVIVGILAGLSIPRYTKTTERARDREAVSVLKQIKAAENFYRVKYGRYFPGGPSFPSDCYDKIEVINNALHLKLTEKDWDYLVCWTPAINPNFNASATRTNPHPDSFGRSWSIDESTDEPICTDTDGGFNSCPP